MLKETPDLPVEGGDSKLDRFIENWPTQFAGMVRLQLERFNRGETTEEEAMDFLRTNLEGAFNTVEGRKTATS